MLTAENLICDIVQNILNEPLTSEQNFTLGGSKNTFKQAIIRNKGLGKKVIEMMTKLINKHPEKEKQVLEYLKQYLTINEMVYAKNNPNDFNTILNFISKKLKNNNTKKNISFDQDYKIVDISTLQKMGWSIREYVKKATMLSYEVYDELTDEHVTELEKSIKVVSEQPDNRRILLDKNNNMIGMWSFKPFYNNIFKKAKNGELYDSEIKPSMMPTLMPGGIYNIYFSNIVLKEKYRKSKVFGILFNSILNLLEEWADENIFVHEICAQAYSDSGINLCKTLGLDFIKNHEDHGKIYCGFVYDLVETRFCNKFLDLRELYREYKNNLSKE